MAGQDESEKSHDPTQKRLEEARAKGQIPRSQDLLSAVAMAGFVLAAFTFGNIALREAGLAARGFLDHPEGLQPLHASAAVVAPLLPLVLAPALAVILLLVAQRGVLFTGSNLNPTLSRIDPLAAARRRFGSEGLADFTKSAAKLLLVGVALAYLLMDRIGVMLGSVSLDPGPLVIVLLRLLLELLVLCLVIGLALGALDLLWQIRQHRVRNRMSRQELVDEHKETEGDPHARAERRQRGHEIAMNRMLADVPRADVVIVNPTHYAVALTWQRGSGRPPICVAKGTDEVAVRIRALAVEHRVPIHSDPPTARAIFGTVEVGQSIRPDHFRAVATALRFAEAMRRKTRARG